MLPANLVHIIALTILFLFLSKLSLFLSLDDINESFGSSAEENTDLLLILTVICSVFLSDAS